MNEERFENWKKPIFDDDGWAYPNMTCMLSKIHPYGWRCQNPLGLELGEKVDIGCFSYLNAKHIIMIGDNAQLGSHCSIYSDDTERGVFGKVSIGKGALIGTHTIILPGAVIKANAKIPAGSIIKGETVFEKTTKK